MNNTSPNNPVTEIIVGILACLFVIAGTVLLYLKSINLDSAFVLWGIAGSLFGINLAYKVPSPAQQAQQNAQQQNVQQLLSQALAVLPVFAGLLHSHTPTPQVTMSAHPVQAPQAPVVPPQPQQTAAPMQPAVQSGPPVASPGVPTTTLQPQVPPAPQRDAWSNSSLMQAIQRPPQQ